MNLIKACSLEEVQRESQVKRNELGTCHFPPRFVDCEHSSHWLILFCLLYEKVDSQSEVT